MAADSTSFTNFSNSSLPWCQVWLRHGEKSHANGKGSTGYSHDPELTNKGVEQIRSQTNSLLQKFAPPLEITCSPFLRCRQSAEAMRDVILQVTGIEVPIVVGEYLGNHPHLQLHGAVDPQTLEYKPVVNETLKSFKKRRMPNIIKHNLHANRWYITHGIIVDHLTTHWRKVTSSESQDHKNSYPGRYNTVPTGSGIVLLQPSIPSGTPLLEKLTQTH